MNRTEQKERLSEIIQLAQDTISALKEKRKDLDAIHHKIDVLKDSLYDFFDSEDIIEDFDEMRQNIMNQFFENELESLYDMAYEFQEELESYIDELSESRAEKLNDKYTDLEQVIESFSQDMQEYDEIDTAIEHIKESIEFLKQMKR